MLARFLFALIGTLVCSAVLAGQSSKPLTNEDVVQMVKAGLPDDIVVASIQRSQTNFDVYPDALISLKNSGVGVGIMKAMLAANTAIEKQAVDPARVTTKETPQNPDAPPGTGVYYKSGEKWTEMPMAPNPESKGVGMKSIISHGIYKISAPKSVFVYAGKNSPVALSGRPVFWVSNVGSFGFERNAQIFRLKVKNDSRETEGKGEAVDVSNTRVSDKLFTVTPKEDLKPGEYLLSFGPGSPAYDFGIAGK